MRSKLSIWSLITLLVFVIAGCSNDVTEKEGKEGKIVLSPKGTPRLKTFKDTFITANRDFVEES